MTIPANAKARGMYYLKVQNFQMKTYNATTFSLTLQLTQCGSTSKSSALGLSYVEESLINVESMNDKEVNRMEMNILNDALMYLNNIA